MWMGGDQMPMNAQANRKMGLGLGIDGDGRPMFNLVRRF